VALLSFCFYFLFFITNRLRGVVLKQPVLHELIQAKKKRLVTTASHQFFFFLFFLFMILEISSRTNIWLMTSTLNRFRGKIRNRCIDRAIHIIRRYSDTTHADPQTTKRSLYSLFLKFIQLKRYFYSTFF
jgi:hypothetical protein